MIFRWSEIMLNCQKSNKTAIFIKDKKRKKIEISSESNKN